MPTFQVAIDSRKATAGAQQFNRSVDGMQRRATRFAKGGGKQMAGALKGLVAGFGALMVVRKAMKVIMEFETTMATLKGVTGATDEAMQSLATTARYYGATTRFSASEAGEGLLFLARAGFTVQEAIQALPATLTLATAGALDLGLAADIASNVLSQFGLKAAETQRIVDTLVNTANSANTDVKQLAEVMKMAGPVAGALGIKVEEAAAAAGVLGDSGIQASMAGTNLRGTLSALLGPTTKAEKVIKKLGLDVNQLNPATNNLASIFRKLRDAQMSAADAVEIFGRRNAAAALTMAAGVEKLEELTAANENATGVAQKNAKLLEDTISGSLKSLNSALEEQFLKSGSGGAASGFKAIIDGITYVIREIDNIIYNAVEFWWKAFERFKTGMLMIWESIKWAVEKAIAAIKSVIGSLLFSVNEAMMDMFTNIPKAFLPEGAQKQMADLYSTLYITANLLKKAPDEVKPWTERMKELNKEQDLAFKNIEDRIALAKLEAGIGVPKKGPGELSAEAGAKPFDMRTDVAYTEADRESVRLLQEKNKMILENSSAVAGYISKVKEEQGLVGKSKADLEVIKMREKALKEVREEAIEIANKAEMNPQDRAKYVQELIAGKDKQLQQLEDEIRLKHQLIEEDKKRIAAERDLKRLYDNIGGTVSNALGDIIFNMDKVVSGTYDWASALAGVTKQLAQLIIRYAVLEPIARGIAGGLGGGGTTSMMGNAFSGGTLIPFANGGIIGSPTVFGMTGGRRALIGEAGPEAVLPLERGRDGKLGVKAGGAGAGNTVIHMTVNTPNADSFRSSQKQIISRLKREMQ